MISLWPVVPICEAQRRDVNPEDLLVGGLYRKCKTYRAGGGYDKFPDIWVKRYDIRPYNIEEQFVVQLKGCTLNCPYCYVTKKGVHGEGLNVSTRFIVDDFKRSGCGVFHLMGGAPAIYLDQWPDLLEALQGAPFHSDFILNEGDYDVDVLQRIAKYPNQLHAVSIKGEDVAAYKRNTNTDIDPELFLSNLHKLVDCAIPFYVTFTGMSDEAVSKFKQAISAGFPNTDIFRDSFSIKLVDYKALH